mmetsp:Transcript_8696/g.28665  ORF Transcript_8696/g.28665 Transcript_8696/m.28665 type:complete len:911 (-) Transcript_8696:137-2869(-)
MGGGGNGEVAGGEGLYPLGMISHDDVDVSSMFAVKTVQVLESIDGSQLQGALRYMSDAIRDLQAWRDGLPVIDPEAFVPKADFDALKSEYDDYKKKQSDIVDGIEKTNADLVRSRDALEAEQVTIKGSVDGHSTRIEALENLSKNSEISVSALKAKVAELDMRAKSADDRFETFAGNTRQDLKALDGKLSTDIALKADGKDLADLTVRVIALEAAGPQQASPGEGGGGGLAKLLNEMLGTKADKTEVATLADSTEASIGKVRERVEEVAASAPAAGAPAAGAPSPPAPQRMDTTTAAASAVATELESLRKQIEQLRKDVDDNILPAIGGLEENKANMSDLTNLLEQSSFPSAPPPAQVVIQGDDSGLAAMVNSLGAQLHAAEGRIAGLRDDVDNIDLSALEAAVDELARGQARLKAWSEKAVGDVKLRMETLASLLDTTRALATRLEETKADKGKEAAGPGAGGAEKEDVAKLKKAVEMLARAATIKAVGHGFDDASPLLPALYGSYSEGLGLDGVTPPATLGGMGGISEGEELAATREAIYGSLEAGGWAVQGDDSAMRRPAPPAGTAPNRAAPRRNSSDTAGVPSPELGAKGGHPLKTAHVDAGPIVDLEWLQSLRGLMESGGVQEKADLSRLVELEGQLLEVLHRLSEVESKVAANARSLRNQKKSLAKVKPAAPARIVDGDNTVLASKRIFGYKCMACDRPLEKLTCKHERLPSHELVPHLPIKFMDQDRIERELRALEGSNYYSGSASESERPRTTRSPVRYGARSDFPAITPSSPAKPSTAPQGATRPLYTPKDAGTPFVAGPHLVPGGYRAVPQSSRGTRGRKTGVAGLLDEAAHHSQEDASDYEEYGRDELLTERSVESFGGRARDRHARATKRAAHKIYGGQAGRSIGTRAATAGNGQRRR